MPCIPIVQTCCLYIFGRVSNTCVCQVLTLTTPLWVPSSLSYSSSLWPQSDALILFSGGNGPLSSKRQPSLCEYLLNSSILITGDRDPPHENIFLCGNTSQQCTLTQVRAPLEYRKYSMRRVYPEEELFCMERDIGGICRERIPHACCLLDLPKKSP